MVGAAFAGGYTCHHLRPVSHGLLGVESAGVAGHPLRDDLGVFVYEDAHLSLLCEPPRRRGPRAVESDGTD